MKKIKAFLISVFKRRELWIDTIGIIFIVTIMTIIPLSYEQIDIVIGRVSLVMILTFVLLALIGFVAIRILKRNLTNPFDKKLMLPLILRGVVALAGIGVFATVMVKVMHPTFYGVDMIELAVKEQIFIKIINGIFFVLYSQVLISIFTGIEEVAKSFYKRLVKTWLISILPISVMSLMFTYLVEWIKDKEMVIAYSINIALTTFLWVVSIGLNEWLKGEK